MPLISSSELDPGHNFGFLRRRWTWLFLPLVVVPWAASFLSTSQQDQFDASARGLFSETSSEAAVRSGRQSTSFWDRLLENELRLATGDAAERLTDAEAAPSHQAGGEMIIDLRDNDERDDVWKLTQR